MTAPINMTLYRLLVKAGAAEADAEDAARLEVAELVTKDELRAAVAGLEAKIERQTVQVLGGVALLLGLFSAVGKFL